MNRPRVSQKKKKTDSTGESVKTRYVPRRCAVVEGYVSERVKYGGLIHFEVPKCPLSFLNGRADERTDGETKRRLYALP